jgi:hypothetical protein
MLFATIFYRSFLFALPIFAQNCRIIPKHATLEQRRTIPIPMTPKYSLFAYIDYLNPANDSGARNSNLGNPNAGDLGTGETLHSMLQHVIKIRKSRR